LAGRFSFKSDLVLSQDNFDDVIEEKDERFYKDIKLMETISEFLECHYDERLQLVTLPRCPVVIHSRQSRVKYFAKQVKNKE